MPLQDVVRLANAVQGQVAAGAPPAFLGPPLHAGERGQGLLSLTEYVGALRLVGAAVSDDELVTRVRLMLHPSDMGFTRLYRPDAGLLRAPAWYPGTTANEVDRSRALATLARTGFVEVVPAPGDRPQLAAVGPAWLAFDRADMGVHLSVVTAQLPVGVPEPAELRLPSDLVSWAGGLARAWFSWHVWRQGAHNRPVAGWAAAEAGAIDPAQVKRALARRMPVEVLRGAMDAAVLTAARLGANPRPPVADLFEQYYAPPPAVPGPVHVSNRRDRFLADSPTFAPLAAAGTLTQADIQPVARRAVRLAITRCLVLWGFRPMVPAWRDTPWALAAADLLADQLAAVLAGTAGPMGAWPDAGFGARAVGPDGTTQRLYGGFDLQMGDDDGARRFGGVVQPAGDPGGRVAELVADLRTLGFTAPAAGTTTFGPRVAMAVREFQVEASQPWLSARRGGAAGWARSWRRYLGEVHGVVDAETRRVLQLWLDLRRLDGERPEHESAAGLSTARNGLRVVVTAVTPDPGPVAAAVAANGQDVWGPMGNPPANRRDAFDYDDTGRRHWGVDALLRFGDPVAAEQPNLALFGAPVPAAGIDAVPLGRFHAAGVAAWDIGGPQTFGSDHWASTLLTWARFQEGVNADMPARQADWRVLYSGTIPETWAYADVVNAWDRALLSLGWCHWTLVLGNGDGEMGGFLSWYRNRDAPGYEQDFRSWGVVPDPWPVQKVNPGKYTGPVRLFGVRVGALADRAQAREARPADAHLYHTWMRSWRVIYRVQQAKRRSPGMWTAMREFSVRRIWDMLATRWTGAAHFDDADTSWADIFNSEQAVTALLRFHINQPGMLFRNAAGAPADFIAGVVQEAVNRYRAVPGVPPGDIPTASLADPAVVGMTQFQDELVARMVAPGVDGQATIRANVAAAVVPPGGPALSRAPGTYPGPPAAFP